MLQRRIPPSDHDGPQLRRRRRPALADGRRTVQVTARADLLQEWNEHIVAQVGRLLFLFRSSRLQVGRLLLLRVLDWFELRSSSRLLIAFAITSPRCDKTCSDVKNSKLILRKPLFNHV